MTLLGGFNSEELSQVLDIESKLLGRCRLDRTTLVPYIQHRGELLRGTAIAVFRGKTPFEEAVKNITVDIKQFVGEIA